MCVYEGDVTARLWEKALYTGLNNYNVCACVCVCVCMHHDSYEARVAKGEYTEAEQQKERVRAQHDLFTFHHDRWAEQIRPADKVRG